MSAIISVFLYLIILFGVATLLFISLVSIWGTTEPVIAYLLSLIITHLILNTFGQIGKKDK
ncbi:hypothetical protein [Evansella tamaricis]|uniref:NADH dehydrogenase subunit 6 n=1 Tax=Evansella tamaricis TaxID=2069301 RepID=A0ABS6JDG9_9BACI|nr:hypothetical protein [Evansella tamaricis]MBU9711719.1 hypothetical protein [Evansella tamaricis]